MVQNQKILLTATLFYLSLGIDGYFYLRSLLYLHVLSDSPLINILSSTTIRR